MFSIEPFKIINYPPQTAAFGGVEYSPSGLDVKTVTREVTDVVKSLGDSLERAYEVKTILKQIKTNLLSTKVIPIEAKLDRREVDLDLRYANSRAVDELKSLLRRMPLKIKTMLF